MELTFGNPLVTSGFQGTYGEPEIYQRANPKNFCTGVFGVKYDDNTANIWESWRAGTDVAVEISNNATFTEATFGFKAAMGRITGDLAPAGTDQGMYVDIPLEFAAGTSGDIFQYVP